MLGNMPNVSSLLNQSFGNGGQNPGLSGPGSSQRGGIDTGVESDPLSSIGNVMGFNTSSSLLVASNMANPGSSGQGQGQQFSNPSGSQLMSDQQQGFHCALNHAPSRSSQTNTASAPPDLDPDLGFFFKIFWACVWNKFSEQVGNLHRHRCF